MVQRVSSGGTTRPIAIVLTVVGAAWVVGCGLILDIDDRGRRTDVDPFDAGGSDVVVPREEPGPDAGTCPDGQKRCNGVCVSKKSPDFGCAADACTPCSVLNAASLECSDDGVCQAATCKRGYAFCGQPKLGCSYDLTSPATCGDCGTSCSEGKVCDKGKCSDDCSVGTTNCSGACIDLATNASHCGVCGKKCTAGDNADPACSGSSCVAECRVNYDHCAGNPLTCELKPLFYKDVDKDGWGDPASSPVRQCTGGAGLSTKAGDCHDGDARVFPGQAEYFAEPYRHPTTGASSFDYNCDGVEVDLPGTPHFTTCGADCKASGYGLANSGRVGAGVNDYCGSKTRLSCEAALIKASARPMASSGAAAFECSTASSAADANRCR